MGDVRENQLSPEGQKNTSSSAANYPKAYSSLSPVLTESEEQNPAKDRAQKKGDEITPEEKVQIRAEVDSLFSSLLSLERDTRRMANNNADSPLVSSAMHATRGVTLDSYSCLTLLDYSKTKLDQAKKSGDYRLMAKAVVEHSQVARLVTGYLYSYDVNMDISAHNWLLGLNITKSVSFAIAAAAGASVLGGTLLAGNLNGVISGAAAAFLDNAATEISKGVVGLSDGVGDAITSVFVGTLTGALFGLAGDILSGAPGLSSILGHSNVVVNMVANSAYNLSFDTSFWGSIKDVASKILKVREIDFDYTIPYSIQSFLLHKNIVRIDSDLQMDSRTGRYVNNAPDHRPVAPGRVSPPLTGIQAVMSPNNLITGTYDGQRIMDRETYLNKNNVVEVLNEEKVLMSKLIDAALVKIVKFGEKLDDIYQNLTGCYDAVQFWNAHSGEVYFNEREFVNRTITGGDNKQLYYNNSDEYRLNSHMQLTYQGKAVVTVDEYVQNEKVVKRLNGTLIPNIKEMAYVYLSMSAYISAVLDAMHGLRE